jgi:hypothetical protein
MVLPEGLKTAPLLSPSYHSKSMTGLLMHPLHLKRLSLIGFNFVRALFIGRRPGRGMENQALILVHVFECFLSTLRQRLLTNSMVFFNSGLMFPVIVYSGQQYLLRACHLNIFIDYQLVDKIILQNHERITKQMQDNFKF